MRFLLPLSAAAFLAVAAPASGSVRLGVGINGVKIGQTQAQVRANLGSPSKTVKSKNDFGPVTTFRYTALKMVVTFQNNSNVTDVATTGLGDRTAGGVGVGSSLAYLKAKLVGEKCESVTGSLSICHIGKLGAGSRVTTFRLKSQKVTEVSVGIVID